MATRTFVKLVNLLDVTFFDQTEEEAKNWKWDVLNGVGENCYTVNCTTKEMSASEIEFVEDGSVKCYTFTGFPDAVSFYEADWIVVKERSTGDLYMMLKSLSDLYNY